MAASIGEAEIQDWCLSCIRRTIEDPAVKIGPDIPFARMGLDSAKSVYFVLELEEWLGIELNPEIVADHPTVAELARTLAGRPMET